MNGIVILFLVAALALGILFYSLARRTSSNGGAAQGLRAMLSPWFWVLAICATAIVIFAGVAEDVYEREAHLLDNGVRVWLLARQDPLLHFAMRALTALGSARVLAPLAVLSAWWLARRTSRWRISIALILPLLAGGAVELLKLVFARVRPEGGLGPGARYSFPSGHTAVATSFILTLAYVLYREGKLRRWQALALLVIPLLVGFSRVYLDLHWTTDVIGGWSVGFLMAAGSAGLYERFRGTAHNARSSAKGSA